MDLTTKYLGLTLDNPLVPSASPLSKSLDLARQLEDNGAAALIMYSLFEEAITAESETMTRFLHQQDTGFAESDSGFLPDWHDFGSEQEHYLEQLARLKQALGIPVVASLNGITPGGWVRHGRQLADAGADALEVNVYYIAADIEQTSAEVEERYLAILRELKAQIDIPINMKLSPSFSAIGNMIKRLAENGASGVALFNRFYQPDINIDSLRLQSSLNPSTSAEALLAMRWIALLYGRIDGLSLGATGGVHGADDAIKLLLAGADVVHLCSTLLQHGPGQVKRIRAGLEEWMEQQGFETVDEVRGQVSALTVSNPADFERANYVNVIDSYSLAPGVRY